MVQKSWVFRLAGGGGFHYVGRAQWAAWRDEKAQRAARDTSVTAFLEISLFGSDLELARWAFDATTQAPVCTGRRQIAPDALLSAGRLLRLLQEFSPAAAHSEDSNQRIDDYLQELFFEAGSKGRRLHRVA